MRRKTLLHLVALSALVLFFTSACATTGEIMDTERRLSAAGFQMRLADTPEKLAKLQAMPQRTLVPRSHNGQTMFVYADAEHCKCLYAGTQEANQRYSRLAIAHDAQVRRQNIASDEAAASMNMDMWGPWGPWY